MDLLLIIIGCLIGFVGIYTIPIIYLIKRANGEEDRDFLTPRGIIQGKSNE